MNDYRKKPVLIKAWQYTKDSAHNAPKWIEREPNVVLLPDRDPIQGNIVTLEGDMTISENDYIIRGVQGELYPCKPDIFRNTYTEDNHRVLKKYTETKRDVFEDLLSVSKLDKKTKAKYQNRFNRAQPVVIPVLPKPVADWLEWCRANSGCNDLRGALYLNGLKEYYAQVDREKTIGLKDWLLWGSQTNQENFARAWLTGAYNIAKN